MKTIRAGLIFAAAVFLATEAQAEDLRAFMVILGRWCNFDSGEMLIFKENTVTRATLDGTPEVVWHVKEYGYKGRNVVVEWYNSNGQQVHTTFSIDALTLTQILEETGERVVLRRCVSGN